MPHIEADQGVFPPDPQAKWVLYRWLGFAYFQGRDLGEPLIGGAGEDEFHVQPIWWVPSTIRTGNFAEGISCFAASSVLRFCQRCTSVKSMYGKNLRTYEKISYPHTVVSCRFRPRRFAARLGERATVARTYFGCDIAFTSFPTAD